MSEISVNTGRFFEAAATLPVFDDAEMKVSTRLHKRTCKARRRDDGTPAFKSRKCGCGASHRVLEKGTIVEGQKISDNVAFVRPVFGDMAAFFVEWRGLRGVQREEVRPLVPEKKRSRVPNDALVVEELIERAKTLPRELLLRKRTPKGGEIVVLRSQSKELKPPSWRYFGKIESDGEKYAFLIDPRLSVTESLRTPRERCLTVKIEKKLSETVICVFPWPDVPEPERWT